jgi:hypothetical protein
MVELVQDTNPDLYGYPLKGMPVECVPNIEYTIEDFKRFSRARDSMVVQQCFDRAYNGYYYNPVVFKSALKDIASSDNDYFRGATREVFRILYCVPLDDVPLFIHYPIEGLYAQFRLDIGK